MMSGTTYSYETLLQQDSFLLQFNPSLDNSIYHSIGTMTSFRCQVAGQQQFTPSSIYITAGQTISYYSLLLLLNLLHSQQETKIFYSIIKTVPFRCKRSHSSLDALQCNGHQKYTESHMCKRFHRMYVHQSQSSHIEN